MKLKHVFYSSFCLVILSVFAVLCLRHKPGPAAPDSTPKILTECAACRQVLPEAKFFAVRPDRPKIFEGNRANSAKGLQGFCGYAFNSRDTIDNSQGYSGPIALMIGLSPSGKITSVACLVHSETPAYVENLAAFLQRFSGKNIQSPLILGQDIDGMTGATISSEAIARIVRESVTTAWREIKSPQAPETTAAMSSRPNPESEKLKQKFDAVGLKPQEAKYWKIISP